MTTTVTIPKVDGGTRTETYPNWSLMGGAPTADADATGMAADIGGILGQMSNLSYTIGAEAQTLVDGLLALDPPDLTSIDYTPPNWSDTDFLSKEYQSIAGALTNVPEAESAVTRGSSSFNDVAPASADISTPDTLLPSGVSAPTLSSMSAAQPMAPASYEIGNIPESPGFDIGDVVLDTPTAPTLDLVSITLPDTIDLDPLSLTIDSSALDKAIDSLTSYVVPENTIPEYNQLYSELYAVVGSMLNGSFDIIDYLNYSVPTSRLKSAMLRRGEVVPPEVDSYEEWLSGDLQTHSELRTLVSDAREKDSVLLTAYQLGTDAELLLFDLFSKTQDSRFQYEMAIAQSNAYKARAVVLAYNAKLLQLNADIVQYNALVTTIKAEAQVALAESEGVKIIGDANQLIAREFAVTEDAKKSQASLYDAKVKAEAAKLDAYRAELSSYAAQVAKAQASTQAYAADVQEYITSIEVAKNQYDLYATKADAVVQENRRIVASVKADSSKTSAYATKARALAANVSVESVKNLRSYIDKAAEYTSVTNANAKADAELSKKMSEFSIRLSDHAGNVAYDGILPAAYTLDYQSISSVTQSSAAAATQAAELSQRASESLSRAYAQAYEAAGRAGASIAAGKLSGFRASATLSAGASLSGSDRFSRSYTHTGSEDYAYQEQVNETVAGA